MFKGMHSFDSIAVPCAFPWWQKAFESGAEELPVLHYRQKEGRQVKAVQIHDQSFQVRVHLCYIRAARVVRAAVYLYVDFD